MVINQSIFLWWAIEITENQRKGSKKERMHKNVSFLAWYHFSQDNTMYYWIYSRTVLHVWQIPNMYNPLNQQLTAVLCKATRYSAFSNHSFHSFITISQSVAHTYIPHEFSKFTQTLRTPPDMCCEWIVCAVICKDVLYNGWIKQWNCGTLNFLLIRDLFAILW